VSKLALDLRQGFAVAGFAFSWLSRAEQSSKEVQGHRGQLALGLAHGLLGQGKPVRRPRHLHGVELRCVSVSGGNLLQLSLFTPICNLHGLLTVGG
jgi:hypothetical protein